MTSNIPKEGNSDEKHNNERTPKIKIIGKSVAKSTAKAGIKTTKTVARTSARLAWNTTKLTLKTIRKKTSKTVRGVIGKFILANLAIVIPALVVIAVLLMGVSSMASTIAVVYAKDKIDTAQADAANMLDTYTQYLLENVDSAVIDYSDGTEQTSGNINTSSLTGQGDPFKETIDTATELSGSSLATQLYNAMVTAQNKYNEVGFDAEYIYGVAITETCCSPVKWLPYVPIGTDYNADGSYDVKSYGMKEFMKARDEGKIDTVAFSDVYNDGASYITPWQMDIDYFGGKGGVASSWSSSTWLSNFSSAPHDPFNMSQVMDVLGNYIITTRKTTITKTNLKTEADKADMMRMIYAIRHVGTTNKTKTRSDGCAFSNYETNPEWRGGNLWCYPYIEGLNPHIDLLRSAIAEYKNNGKFFQEYKTFMVNQSRTNANGGDISIIEKFYEANGWTKSGGQYKKAFGDGDGFVTVQGQDIGYPFRVYWGSKIGLPELKKLAQNS